MIFDYCFGYEMINEPCIVIADYFHDGKALEKDKFIVYDADIYQRFECFLHKIRSFIFKI